MEVHVHCLCPLGLDVAVDDGFGSGVVDLYWHGGLGMPHSIEDVSCFDGFLCIDVQCAKFWFGGGGHYSLDDLGNVEDCTIVLGGTSHSMRDSDVHWLDCGHSLCWDNQHCCAQPGPCRFCGRWSPRALAKWQIAGTCGLVSLSLVLV